MLQNIVLTLSRLGLKQTDIQVLMCLMHHKEGIFAQNIARETNTKRSSVDLILSRLIEEGFCTRLKPGNRYQYFPQDPEKVLFSKEQVLDDYKMLIPLLNRLGKETQEMDIRFFEGVSGIRQLYEDMILRLRTEDIEKREILTINSGRDILRIIPDFEHFFDRKRQDMKVPVRVIAPTSSSKSKITQTDVKFFREVKYFNEDSYPFRISIEIYADTIALYSTVKPMNGVIIRNGTIAQSMKSLFNLLWGLI